LLLTTLYRFFAWLSARAALLHVRDADREIDKLAFIRVATGIVTLARVVPIVYGGHFYFYGTLVGPFAAATVSGAVMVALLLCLTVGLFTPIALAALLLLIGPYDQISESATLGTTILALILPLLLLTGSGSRRSVDATLMRSDSRAGRFVRMLYAVPGRLDSDALRVIYFLIFITYAALSFGAVVLHANDMYWREGRTLQVMLTSSYLSRWYWAFRAIEASAPSLMHTLSAIGSAAQALFQLLMIPLIFTRVGGWLVALWGLGFFLASAFLLELSYLPYLELLLWAALFVRTPSLKPVAIYYDDYCNLCKRTMQTLRAIDFVGTFEFRPASKHEADVAKYGLGDLSASLHGVYRDRVYVGYDFYQLVATRAPALWILAPVLWLLRVVRVGPALYDAVARNRRRVFGTCEVAYDANKRGASRFVIPSFRQLVPTLGAICGVFAATWFGTLVLRLPDIETGRMPPRVGIYRLGFDVPNVFNEADLRMGDAWSVIHRAAADGSWELVPFHGLDGEKLFYPRLVDILYFGNSLRWRRRAIGHDLKTYAGPDGRGGPLTQRAIAFDDRIRGNNGGRYRVDVYRTDGSNVRRSDPQKYVPQLVDSYEVRRGIQD
jgi:predicted DCC family thiol-disulfide oxidoreductase YuxK